MPIADPFALGIPTVRCFEAVPTVGLPAEPCKDADLEPSDLVVEAMTASLVQSESSASLIPCGSCGGGAGFGRGIDEMDAERPTVLSIG
jgi:hypothetical protein